jgi:hypothetical protein
MSLRIGEVKAFTELKEVEVQGFKGKDNGIDFLEVLLRCETILERVTVRLSSKVLQSDRGYLKISSLLKGYPFVECNVSLTQRNNFCRYD